MCISYCFAAKLKRDKFGGFINAFAISISVLLYDIKDNCGYISVTKQWIFIDEIKLGMYYYFCKFGCVLIIVTSVMFLMIHLDSFSLVFYVVSII